MSEWKEHKLSELCEITSSKRIFYSDYVKDGIPFWRSKEVIEQFNRKEVSTELYITYKKYEDIMNSHGVPQENDILLTSVGTIGKTYLVKNNDKFYFKDGNLTWFRNHDRAIVEPKFLKLWIDSSIGQEALNSITIGSTQEALTIRSLKDLKISLPPLPEQKAIAGVLSSLDDKIDLLHRQNKTLEAMAETLFRQWFIEEAEDDWEHYKLSNFIEHVKTTVVPQANPSTLYYHYSIPAYDNNQTPILELGKEIQSNKYLVVEKSILVSKLNPMTSRIWSVYEQKYENPICSTEFLVLCPNDPRQYGFFYMLLKSSEVVSGLSMAASGTSGSHQRVKSSDIMNIKFTVPDISAMGGYSELISPWLSKIDNNKNMIITLAKLRDTLLPKLMSGEVRVDI